jgi:hypothetical protein
VGELRTLELEHRKSVAYIRAGMTPEWSLFSNHGLVLTTIARRPDLRLREIAAQVGITERAVQTLVGDLARAGYLERIREGRRNRYMVRGDRPITTAGHRGNELADLITALIPGPLVGPSPHDCEAVVLACSDFAYQEPLRNMVAAEGLLGRAEMILLPGGASALAGRDGTRILAGLETVAGWRQPERVLLVAHQGCTVPGAFIAPRRDAFDARRAVAARRKEVVGRVRRRLGLDPELWFLDVHGARRVRKGGRGDGLDPVVAEVSPPADVAS